MVSVAVQRGRRMQKRRLVCVVALAVLLATASLVAGKGEDRSEQKRKSALWEEHTLHEFVTKDTEATLATMVDDAYVNDVPTLTGGLGKEALREFYSKHFIPHIPADMKLELVSRTIDTNQNRLVDELYVTFTHDIVMDWFLPGIQPTGKKVESALVAVVEFEEEKLKHEHIYWDQASVLVQLGLLNRKGLPVVGAESARKVRNPSSIPSNELYTHAGKDEL